MITAQQQKRTKTQNFYDESTIILINSSLIHQCGLRLRRLFSAVLSAGAVLGTPLHLPSLGQLSCPLKLAGNINVHKGRPKSGNSFLNFHYV